MSSPLSILGLNAVEALAGNAHIRYFILYLVWNHLSCAYIFEVILSFTIKCNGVTFNN